MISVHRYVFACSAMMVASHPVAAQDTTRDTARDTAYVARLVTTATRSPLSADRVPASMTVLTGQQLRDQGIATVAEALRQVPGLSLAQTGSYGGTTSLFIRGGESKYTKVLIDGVPVNDAGGTFDFSTLSTDNLERIEIVRGPTSVLYGSDAVAGVVQLFTRRGVAGVHGDLSARGGGFGSSDVDGTIRGGTAAGDATFSLGGAKHDTRGFQAFNSNFRQQVGSALMALHRGATDARLSARYDDAAFHFPTDGSGQVVDSNAVHREDRLVVGLDAGVQLTSAAALHLALASRDSHGISDNQPDSRADTADYYYTSADRSRRRSGDLRLDIALGSASRLTLGEQVEREWLESGTTSNFGDSPTTNHSRRTTGTYAQLLIAPATPYTATLGGRLEHNERFGDFFTFRTAGSAQIASATRLRASLGTAFREPSFLENFGCCGFVQGNQSLRPEHAVSVDAGVEQRVGALATVGLTYFNNSFRDLIDYHYAAKGPDYFNVARTRASGVELEGRFAAPSGLHGDAAFTYLDTRVVDPGKDTASTSLFVPGGRLLRRPMQTLDVGAGYRGSRAGLDLRVLRVGKREDNYFAPDFSSSHVTVPAYVRTDLSGEVSLVPPSPERATIAATFRVENLLDARYSDVAGFNYDFRRTDDAALRNTGFRGAPRRILAGLRAAF